MNVMPFKRPMATRVARPKNTRKLENYLGWEIFGVKPDWFYARSPGHSMIFQEDLGVLKNMIAGRVYDEQRRKQNDR